MDQEVACAACRQLCNNRCLPDNADFSSYRYFTLEDWLPGRGQLCVSCCFRRCVVIWRISPRPWLITRLDSYSSRAFAKLFRNCRSGTMIQLQGNHNLPRIDNGAILRIRAIHRQRASNHMLCSGLSHSGEDTFQVSVARSIGTGGFPGSRREACCNTHMSVVKDSGAGPTRLFYSIPGYLRGAP